MTEPTSVDRDRIDGSLASNMGPVAGERWQPADDLIDLVDLVVETRNVNLIIRTLAVVRQVAGHLTDVKRA